MPRDTRLYMTFPNDFPEHPKIRPLSDAAFRAFVEINGYSRRHDLDGRVPVKTARSMWKARALTELEQNHPERPTLTRDGDVYVIRDYAEHQQTKAARADLVSRNQENGRKGGRPVKVSPPPPESDGSEEAKCARTLAGIDVDYAKVRAAIVKACGRIPDPSSVVRISVEILSRTNSPRSPTGYVIRSVQNDWPEWQKFLDTQEAA